MTVETAKQNGWQTPESDAQGIERLSVLTSRHGGIAPCRALAFPADPTPSVTSWSVCKRSAMFRMTRPMRLPTTFWAGSVPDGAWRVQTGRPPMESSDIEVTATSLRALQAYGQRALKPKSDRAVGLAKLWLEGAQPRSTEDRAFQLLGFAWAGSSRDLRMQAGQALLKEQRSGWWLGADPIAAERRLCNWAGDVCFARGRPRACRRAAVSARSALPARHSIRRRILVCSEPFHWVPAVLRIGLPAWRGSVDFRCRDELGRHGSIARTEVMTVNVAASFG